MGHFQAQTPFTTTTEPEAHRWQSGDLPKALDQCSLLIPWLKFEDLFQVRNEIHKTALGNLGILGYSLCLACSQIASISSPSTLLCLCLLEGSWLVEWSASWTRVLHLKALRSTYPNSILISSADGLPTSIHHSSVVRADLHRSKNGSVQGKWLGIYKVRTMCNYIGEWRDVWVGFHWIFCSRPSMVYKFLHCGPQ